MDEQTKVGRGGGPRFKYTVTVPTETAKAVKSAAEKWSLPTAAAAAKLLQIGLACEAKTYDPNEQFDALGYTLAAIADRLERLDKLGDATARAAIKSAMVLVRQLKAGANAPDLLQRLDVAVEKEMEEVRK